MASEPADHDDQATSPVDPVQRLVELLVYTPVGLITLASTELPRLVATGRARVDNQLTLAKFIGKMAVNQAKLEVERRLDAAEQARHAASADTTPAEAPTPRVDLDHASLPEAVIELVAQSELLAEAPAPADGGPAIADDAIEVPLPIEGYDSLAASQVVGRLGSLTAAELDTLERYEASHRSRRTILGKINQLRAG